MHEDPTSAAAQRRNDDARGPTPRARDATASVDGEANSDAVEGRTVHGLAPQTETNSMLAAVDGEEAGPDAGAVLDGTPEGIHLSRDLTRALDHVGAGPRGSGPSDVATGPENIAQLPARAP